LFDHRDALARAEAANVLIHRLFAETVLTDGIA
jgi:hypothetical protein